MIRCHGLEFCKVLVIALICDFKYDLSLNGVFIMVAYLPILVFVLFALVVSVVLMLAGFILSPSRPSPAKCAAYECGFPALSNTRQPFDVRFYLVAIVFLLFDLETAFLFPWALNFRSYGIVGLMSMLMFVLVLLCGYVYEWKKGALNWE